jgi:phosphoribosyl 1,2-cyclic phosphodiesterase
MQFRPLASSSAGCAYLLSTPSETLLIDCGVRFAVIQEALNFELSKLSGCLISHSHGDHCSAAAKLLNAGVDCYASRETWSALEKSIRFKHRAHELESGKQISVGEFQVKAFDAVHDAEGTLGFLVSHDSECLLYLTDTAYSKYTFERVTIMAVECNWGEAQMRENSRDGEIHSERFRRTASNHMSLERLLRLFEKNDLSSVREIWLLHLSDANSDEVAFKEAVQRATGKPVYIAAKNELQEVHF